MQTYPFVTTVHRPGLPDVHIGFAFQFQAEHASWSLTQQLISTQHVKGTTITWSSTPPGVEPLPPVPTDSGWVAELIQQEDHDQPYGHAFPDLWARLYAQEGYEQAAAIWSAACQWIDCEAQGAVTP